MLLEVACFDVASCKLAQEAGADRIEFCKNYQEGGLTPESSLILQARKILDIPLHVMIRLPTHNFICSKDEIAEMKNQIHFCKNNGIDGIVFGVLNPDRTINLPSCRELVAAAAPMDITFHRAFDECRNQNAMIQQLISMGIKRVLSSGSAPNAYSGRHVLQKMQELHGKQITIMPGGGIRSGVLAQLIAETACVEYHSSASQTASGFPSAMEIKKMKAIVSNK
jgi:copper homeostasis protein